MLGLSLTSTAVGWVLVGGYDADGAILDHDDFMVRTGGGARAVKTAQRVTAAVLRALATRRDHRLRVIGLTWSDDAAAEAALVLESLIDAGLDNVVPIQAFHAAEMLRHGESDTVTLAQLALGAAVASARSTGFTDAQIVESIDPVPSRSPSYVGATLTMLVAGAVTFVASLSLAVGPRLIPDRSPVQPAVHTSASPPVVEAPAPPPPVAAPPAQAAPQPAPPEEPLVATPPVTRQSGVVAEPPAGPPVAGPEPPPPPVVPPPPPPELNPQLLLANLLARLHGDPAPGEPAPAPPAEPGVPPP